MFIAWLPKPTIIRDSSPNSENRRVVEVPEAELQRFLNSYIEANSSKSLLDKLILFLRAIFEAAVEQELIVRNPARKRKAKSRKRPSTAALALEQAEALLGQVHGRDHLIIGMFIQLGPRSEEQFVLRKNDVAPGQLTIDEALVEGNVEGTKTEASAAVIYIPPGLQVELDTYLDSVEGGPEAWLFPASRKGVPMRPANFLRRVLKPAAVRAGIALRTTPKGDTTSGCNFQWLRRTSATLFGARAKDPRLTQAHMRHADPQVTLQHYQQAIPTEVRAAAQTLENDLLAQQQKREAQLRAEVANARLV